MANPIAFKPVPVDTRKELERRLAEAPTEHAEALLVLWDLLQSAHDQGMLDLVNGMVGAKDKIAGTAAKYARLPEGVAGIRNAIAVVKILTAIDPEMLDRFAGALQEATAEHQQETKAPSLLQLARRATSEDARRGLSFATLMLSSLGRALRR